jgi:predicted AAA+ superfamily ATPase
MPNGWILFRIEKFHPKASCDGKKRDKQLYKSYFLEYIKDGGMPENVLNPNREYLMNLVDDIIQKDITAFHGLKHHQILRDYFLLLMERSGKQLSINKIAKILSISPDTSKRSNKNDNYPP